ncbi:MAG: hypothetical protein F6K44_14975, partial [Moorea sp. SIO3E2]|nr:hypothetical protein [Moorena sp. SIO3E2]
GEGASAPYSLLPAPYSLLPTPYSLPRLLASSTSSCLPSKPITFTPQFTSFSENQPGPHPTSRQLVKLNP